MQPKQHVFSVEGLIAENNKAIKEQQELININNGIIQQLHTITIGEPLDSLRREREILLLAIENRELKGSIEAKENYNNRFSEHGKRK